MCVCKHVFVFQELAGFEKMLTVLDYLRFFIHSFVKIYVVKFISS